MVIWLQILIESSNHASPKGTLRTAFCLVEITTYLSCCRLEYLVKREALGYCEIRGCLYESRSSTRTPFSIYVRKGYAAALVKGWVRLVQLAGAQRLITKCTGPFLVRRKSPTDNEGVGYE